MSIANRHPIIHNMLNDNIKPKPEKKWTIIFYKKTTFDNLEFDKTLFDKTELDKMSSDKIGLGKYLYDITIKSIKKELLVDKIYIYTPQHPENIKYFAGLRASYPINLVEIPEMTALNCTKLLIIKKFMDNKHNIIFFEYNNGYTGNSNPNILSEINNNEYIYANFCELDHAENIYDPIIEKFKLKRLVISNTLIIPFCLENQNYINYTYKIAVDIQTKNDDFATNVALTVSNIKFKNFIKNIKNTIYLDKFVTNDKNDAIMTCTIKELFAQNNNPTREFIPPYNNKKYIFYPYIDIDTEMVPEMINDMSFENGSHTPNTVVFNTNGFSTKIYPNKSLYEQMFKRFDDKTKGIFVKKQKEKIIIPQILHHIWLYDEPNINYINAWSRILKYPWKYIIWTEDNLMTHVINNTNWLALYQNEKSEKAKLLIVYMAVLERYGGFVINSFTLPLKLIPDDLLTGKFMLSFFDEKNSGTMLSYRIIASVPGKEKETSIPVIDYDAARRPFEGKNNFFRNVRALNKKNQNSSEQVEKNNLVIFPEMFKKMYNILSLDDENKFNIIENMIISDPDVVIYPSYYFNPNCYTFPKKMLDLAICVNLYKPITKEKHNKTDIRREYIITPQAIIARLNENPRDRLKNINNLEE